MKRLFIVLGLTFSSIYLFSQEATRLCDTYNMNKRAIQLNSEAILAKESLDKFTKDFETHYSPKKQVYIIPVVFHIIHNNGPENISKEQVLDALRVLNEDYSLRNPDTSLIIPEFKGIAGDCEIEFRLAKIDPNGNCTDGIERIESLLTYNASEETKQAAPAWHRSKYLNVWTVASIESGAAGYSYYPSSVSDSWGENYDGVLQLHSYTGSMGTSMESHKRTLTHEIGHFLNLMHPWGDSNDPGLQENCNDDDQVNDTPNTIGHTSCNLSAVTCGSLDNVQNYMDYSYCGAMFTQGQKVRMQATLNSSISSRNNLWSTQNLIATGTIDGYAGNPCIPIPEFNADKKSICSGVEVLFEDFSYNSDSITIFNWNFPGGIPSSSTLANPTVIYNNSGNFDVSLESGNSTGTATITKSNFISAINTLLGDSVPLFESFENVDIFNNPLIEKQWKETKTGNSGWVQFYNAGSHGSSCITIDNTLNETDDVSVIYSPNIITNDLGVSAIISFKIAYAKISSTTDDLLSFYVSSDCGETWRYRYSRGSAGLVTNDGTYSNNFIPNTSQWRQEYVNLLQYSASPHLMFRFEMKNRNEGAKLYIDEIQLNSTTDVSNSILLQAYQFSINPNPINSFSNIEWISPKNETLILQISDIMGREISNNFIEAVEGVNHFNLSSNNYTSGIYFATLKTPFGNKIIKFVKSE